MFLKASSNPPLQFSSDWISITRAASLILLLLLAILWRSWSFYYYFCTMMMMMMMTWMHHLLQQHAWILLLLLLASSGAAFLHHLQSWYLQQQHAQEEDFLFCFLFWILCTRDCQLCTSPAVVILCSTSCCEQHKLLLLAILSFYYIYDTWWSPWSITTYLQEAALLHYHKYYIRSATTSWMDSSVRLDHDLPYDKSSLNYFIDLGLPSFILMHDSSTSCEMAIWFFLASFCNSHTCLKRWCSPVLKCETLKPVTYLNPKSVTCT